MFKGLSGSNSAELLIRFSSFSVVYLTIPYSWSHFSPIFLALYFCRVISFFMVWFCLLYSFFSNSWLTATNSYITAACFLFPFVSSLFSSFLNSSLFILLPKSSAFIFISSFTLLSIIIMSRIVAFWQITQLCEVRVTGEEVDSLTWCY